jgi:hypothetical protein
MKNYLYLAVFIACLSCCYSCDYKELADADYMDGKLYMPVAYNGVVYSINELTKTYGDVPTPGEVYRYIADRPNNKFIIPLGIYRSGVTADKSISADIAVNASVVDKLISDGVLESSVVTLPEGKYTLASPKIQIAKNARSASFDLAVDFSFLRENTPLQYVVGLSVSSADMEVNADLGTLIVLIDTKMLLPVADFDVSANGKTINFLNNSQYALSCSWDFGDGTSSAETNPVHTYENPGTYPVKLSLTGLYGDVISIEKEIIIMSE